MPLLSEESRNSGSVADTVVMSIPCHTRIFRTEFCTLLGKQISILHIIRKLGTTFSFATLTMAYTERKIMMVEYLP
jgi:hypothetical protein